MLVYRIASREEIEYILKNKCMSEVGNFFKRDNTLSSFDYIRNIRYMHFYEEKSNFLHLYRPSGCYLCTYEIDEDLLLYYEGFGIYLDLFFNRNQVKVKEYAIPTGFVSFENLISIEELTGDIDIEYFESDYKASSVLKYKKL